MRCVIVIPARMGSTRFPGKPLADLCGRPMIQWVYEASVASGVADDVFIATPDDEIVAACKAFGAKSVLTSLDCPTGTDRIAEVANSVQAEVYINVQGDEPLMPSKSIEICARTMIESPGVEMASVYGHCEESDLDDPAAVKVVTDSEGFALYFSRYPIPFSRSQRLIPVKKHIGLYGYSRASLQNFSTWPQTPLEVAESLEQLRFMENGVKIRMSQAEGTALAVDTPEQAETVRKILMQTA